MSGPPEQQPSAATAPQVATAPDWKRFGRGTVVPILLLLALLFFLGHLHIDLAGGYMAPRVVTTADDGALVFYDEGSRGDPAFYFRRTDDGASFGKRTRVSGLMASAAAADEHLIALFAPTITVPERKRWFVAIYELDDLERTWNEEIVDPDLRLPHPRHVATLDERVYVFGTDADGALRAATLTRTGDRAGLLPVEARLGGATLLPADPDEDAALEERRAAKGVPGPAVFESAVVDGRLHLFWRAVAEPSRPGASEGRVRWTTFDGEAFGELHELEADLVALAPTVADGFGGEEPRLILFGAERGAEETTVLAFAQGEEGWEQVGEVPYEAEGFAGAAAIHSLGVGAVGERLLLFAQIGGAIRFCARDEGKWGEWVDFARLPVEQRAVVYGWFFALLSLCGVLMYQGWRRYTDRAHRLAAREATELEDFCRPALREEATAGDEAPAALEASPSAAAVPAAAVPAVDLAAAPATLAERTLAFSSDVLLVALVSVGLAELAPAAVERAADDPRARLALIAIFLGALVAYFTAFEALFARTPGKWLLGLEVQDVHGGRPGLPALLYRNLFRIELIVPPPYPVALISLVVMLYSRHRQRPGDLVAHTVVRRSAA